MRRSDGGTFEAEVSIREVPGQRQFVATLRDVTERRRVQINQSRLAAIINSSDDAIIAKRLDETITDWNPAAERLYGYTAAEVLGHSIDVIIPPERREENRELTGRVSDGQSVARFETVRVHKDGSRRDISLSVSPIRDQDGEVIGAAIIGHDISAQKRVEEQMQQALERQQQAIDELKHINRLKSDFVSIVSHEFRTPLTGIMGFSEVLRDEQLTPEEVIEYAADIHKDAERLARLINDMLDLDRLESGRISLQLEPVDVNAVVRDVAAQFRGFSAIHSIKLELEADLPMIRADRDKLTQALTNFVSNAIKYSPGGGDVWLSTRVTQNVAELTVRDPGMGIPSDALDVIFERYARVESAGARHIQGTGLGLPIVRQIARLHGGDAWAESELGRGSTFHLRLPLQAEGVGPKENG